MLKVIFTNKLIWLILIPILTYMIGSLIKGLVKLINKIRGDKNGNNHKQNNHKPQQCKTKDLLNSLRSC